MVDKFYNKTLNKVYKYLDKNPDSSAYTVAKGIRSDPRTVQEMLGILKRENIPKTLIEIKIVRGTKTYMNYKLGEEKMETQNINELFIKELDKLLGKDYRIGQIWRHTDKSLGGVVPIIKDNIDNIDDRDYVMMEEVKDQITITDTGQIDKIKANSKVDKPVFVRMGTMFKGSTQERAADVSMIIFPNKEQELTVKCIHASKGIHGGAIFAMAGAAPHIVEKAFASGAGQSATWASVTAHNTGVQYRTERMMSRDQISEHWATDDLVGTREKIKAHNKDANVILKNIPSVEGQIGCIIFDQKGILSIEFYDHPLSWKAYHESIYEKYEDILLDEQAEALFTLDKKAIPKLIQAFIIDMKAAVLKEVKHEKFSTYLLNKTVIGEFTEYANKIIHILGIRKDDSEMQNTVRPGIIIGTNSFRPSQIYTTSTNKPITHDQHLYTGVR